MSFILFVCRILCLLLLTAILPCGVSPDVASVVSWAVDNIVCMHVCMPSAPHQIFFCIFFFLWSSWPCTVQWRMVDLRGWSDNTPLWSGPQSSQESSLVRSYCLYTQSSKELPLSQCVSISKLGSLPLGYGSRPAVFLPTSEALVVFIFLIPRVVVIETGRGLFRLVSLLRPERSRDVEFFSILALRWDSMVGR